MEEFIIDLHFYVMNKQLNIFVSDIDNCLPNTCENGGTCFDEVDTFVCQCREGFTGTHCETGIRYLINYTTCTYKVKLIHV